MLKYRKYLVFCKFSYQ